MKFHISQILTVTTGIMVSNNGMEGVYGILNHMTGDNLFTHQLPRALRECKPHLLKEHPDLNDVDASEVTPDNVTEWVADKVRKYGEYRSVEKLPDGVHEQIDPISEAEDMFNR